MFIGTFYGSIPPLFTKPLFEKIEVPLLTGGGGGIMKVAGVALRVGIKLPLWSTLFTVWSMQAVAGREGGVVLFSDGNPYITF